ncbi:MAG: transglycosylase SLT domain-containing protein [Herminiimonas sp.]|nr:transglycosylase SLT domain-containing protein [Herminiimonas sp.]
MNRRKLLSTMSVLAGSLIAPPLFGIDSATAKGTKTRSSHRVYAPMPIGYQKVGQIENIPPLILYGVALQESSMMFGPQSLPYPWTLNVAGAPKRFASYDAAVAALCANVARGVTSVDCGLMQVNWRYHSAKLVNFYRALDPYPNLQAGATILRGHFKDTGDWFKSVGRYHNGADPQRAHAYATSVFQRMAVLHA